MVVDDHGNLDAGAEANAKVISLEWVFMRQ